MSSVQSRHEDLCRELNMDRETEETSWKMYSEVSQRFSLEGDPAHWFCCSLYAACRGSCTPTVGAGSNVVVMGNCVSLNKLMRCCSMSMTEFFSKTKSWNEMAKSPSQLCNQIDRLERSFSTTFHLYQHYYNIMSNLYYFPTTEKKNMKFRSVQKCSANKLNDLCWCLYLCAKNENPNITVDLVTSFHLLICCIEFVYKNVLAEHRFDLINTEFEGVPAKWNTTEFDAATISNLCIVDHLCRLVQSSELPEIKTMRERTWRSIIKEFFRHKTIYGNEETFLDIVSNENFERNLKSLHSAYEQYVLSVGEFDERILLNNSSYRKASTAESGGNLGRSGDQHAAPDQIRSLIPNTPYTRKHALPSKDANSEPIANATNNVKKLLDVQTYSEPPEIIKQAGAEVEQKILNNLQLRSAAFHANYPNGEEASARFQLAKCLNFYLLEKIVHVEIRTKPNIDLKQLLNTDQFSTALTVCCVEIVLAAYNSEQKFPWVLNCFGVEAFNFWKIIEFVVGRHDGILTREVIKHLNSVEEKCLEQLSWHGTSTVWDIVGSEPLPGWSEVDATNISIRREPQMHSPMNSACDSFTPTVSESARRDLFNATRARALVATTDGAVTPTPTTTTTTTAASTTTTTTTVANNEANTNKRTLLRFFLRKVYKLSWLRIKELCSDLSIVNEPSLNEIWTLFEYSLTHMTVLIKDRHLDQLLMCAIYIYIKVGEMDILFTDIMKFYRKQPQAASSTYREVLIENENGEKVNKDIIYFYNEIYVKQMTPYALKFSSKKKSQHDLLLSPHPTEHRTLPVKISNNHSVFISPMEKNDVTYSPNHITYEIGKSPGKDLVRINECVRKRDLPFNDDPAAVTLIERKFRRTDPTYGVEPPYVSRIRGMISDRLQE